MPAYLFKEIKILDVCAYHIPFKTYHLLINKHNFFIKAHHSRQQCIAFRDQTTASPHLSMKWNSDSITFLYDSIDLLRDNIGVLFDSMVLLPQNMKCNGCLLNRYPVCIAEITI